MRRTLIWMLVLGGAIQGATLYVRKVQASPVSGFSTMSIALGRFEDIEASNQASWQEDSPRSGLKSDLWMSFQRTQGPSDLHVQSNVWAPGGTTGWHTHPGHSLIIVTDGAVTAYDGHDPSCTPHRYSAGMGFVDAGGDHVHVLRNEGAIEARTVAVQLVAAGATRRIDGERPASCPF